MNATLLKLYRWNWIPYLILAVAGGWFAYDTFVPAVVVRAELASKSSDRIIISMVGYKVRECKYLGIQAYSIGPSGLRNDATITRVDTEAKGTTRPRGYYYMGLWDIHPTTGATGVVVYAQHSCGLSDLRMTKMAEVAL